MASRRTRIKGIANIPQRRKTTGVNGEELLQTETDVGGIEIEKPSLNLQQEAQDATLNTGQELSIHDSLQPISDTKLEAEDNESQASAECTGKTKEVSQSDDRLSIHPNFIKPSISLNALSRKPKDAECVEMMPKSPRNNKIIILNQIITYPNQSQHVLIQSPTVYPHAVNNESPKVQSHLLKPSLGVAKPSFSSLEKDVRRLVPSSPQPVTTDIEYPIPPPSPNKINRSRIKAVPRLGQRHTSFSASESEDESRRNYRHRNDSVCSTASGHLESLPECLSPQKPKDFNSVIQRKCRRTEQSRKLAEARRDFYLKFGNEKPDRHKLTMIDLIFYNPSTNTMSHDSKNKKEVETENHREVNEEEEAADDPSKSGSDEENEVPAPQIKIGPQGEIVVDEQSLVIENKTVKKNREELAKSKVIDGNFDTGYGIYKRAKRSKDWSKEETLKFYKALNTIGTDFTLMCELFPRRSRRELKMKFKKEERINKTLVDRAVMQPCGFDFNDLKHEVDMEEKELMELEKQKERERQMKKEAKKRKMAAKPEPAEKVPKLIEKPKEKKKKRTLDIFNVLDDSDADESEVDSTEDDREEKLLQTIQKPTRSGRVPKILDRYAPPKSTTAPPGSLIVVAGTGSNGEPVYRVCMVTGEHSRQQIGEDMGSLSKALECKQNTYVQSLFTLSTSMIEDLPENNQTIPAEENNITIPAEVNNTTVPAEENNSTIPAEENNTTIPA